MKSSGRTHRLWWLQIHILCAAMDRSFSSKGKITVVLKSWRLLNCFISVRPCWIHLCDQDRWGQDFFNALSASQIQMLFIKGFHEITWCDPEYNLACCTDWNVIYFMILPGGRVIVLMLGRRKDCLQQSVLLPVTRYNVHAWLSQPAHL